MLVVCSHHGVFLGTLHCEVPPYPQFSVAAWPDYVFDPCVNRALNGLDEYVRVVCFQRGVWRADGRKMDAAIVSPGGS